jgi:hypothetical protein
MRFLYGKPHTWPLLAPRVGNPWSAPVGMTKVRLGDFPVALRLRKRNCRSLDCAPTARPTASRGRRDDKGEGDAFHEEQLLNRSHFHPLGWAEGPLTTPVGMTKSLQEINDSLD